MAYVLLYTPENNTATFMYDQHGIVDASSLIIVIIIQMAFPLIISI